MMECLSQANLDQIHAWNSGNNPFIDGMIERCVHDVIAEQFLARPDAEALSAWDGSLTYHELDIATEHLAARLVQMGVGPEVNVPLCFDKSVRG